MSDFFVEGNKPGFFPLKEAACCACSFDGRFLILKKTRVWPGFWSFPGGGLEKGESSEVGVLRELFEETKILASSQQLEGAKKFSVRNKWGDYTLYTYLIHFSKKPEVLLNEEHSEFTWVGPSEFDQYKYLPGGEKILKIYEEYAR